MAAPSLVIKSIDTKPIAGQAMGTSGLRKKVRNFFLLLLFKKKLCFFNVFFFLTFLFLFVVNFVTCKR